MSVDNVIGIGSDHGGVELKAHLTDILKSKGFEVIDFGTDSSESVDYPEYGAKIAEAVSSGRIGRAVALCGSGIGISITANKFPNVRSALCHDTYTAEMSRRHNNSNILAMGGRNTGFEDAAEILHTWLNTEFEAGRHERRINMIDTLAKDAWEAYLKGDR